MRNSRGDLRGIPFPSRDGVPQAPARSRLAKAPGEVFGPKCRPFRQRVIAVCQALPWCNFTLKDEGRHCAPAVVSAPTALGSPTTFSEGRSPVGGGNGGHVEMAETLISKRPLKVISNRFCWK